MRKNNKQENKWEENENKCISMCDKFIAAIKNVDSLSSWESIMIDRIVVAKMADSSKCNRKLDFDSIISTLEDTFGFTALKGDSIAEQMKIEAFVEDLYKNPYQLNLIQ